MHIGTYTYYTYNTSSLKFLIIKQKLHLVSFKSFLYIFNYYYFNNQLTLTRNYLENKLTGKQLINYAYRQFISLL